MSNIRLGFHYPNQPSQPLHSILKILINLCFFLEKKTKIARMMVISFQEFRGSYERTVGKIAIIENYFD